MNYHRLKEIFEKANKDGREIEGFITFSNSSFDKEYDVAARTYVVSSDNKAFQAGKNSNSVFGTSLDKSDTNVRLDIYMDSWQVENCGTLNYELLTTYSGETSVELFNTHHAAMSAMRLSIANSLGCKENELYEVMNTLNEEDGGFICHGDGAWLDRAGVEKSRVEWKIITIGHDGEMFIPFVFAAEE